MSQGWFKRRFQKVKGPFSKPTRESSAPESLREPSVHMSHTSSGEESSNATTSPENGAAQAEQITETVEHVEDLPIAPVKSNFDVMMKVASHSNPIRINTCLLRFSKVLDDMFDKIQPEENLPIVPLYQDDEGVAGFLQYYYWATRDAQFRISEENLPKILRFIDKFEIPLLLQEVISWTRTPAHEKDTKFCIKMIFLCLEYDLLSQEIYHWYKAITDSSTRMKVPEFLASEELAAQVGNPTLIRLILGTIYALENTRSQSARLPGISAFEKHDAFFRKVDKSV